jgi:hypothetical protein
MSTTFYVNSLIEVLHFVSDNLLQCDAGTTLGELFDDEFDDLDFELALTCFEATNKVAFKEGFWKSELEKFDELTIEEFIESQLDQREVKDPLFVTKRFLLYERSLTDALREEYEGPAPGFEP